MTFCVNTKDHGIFVHPDGYWNGKAEKDYYFEVLGTSDSDYAKDLVTRKSVSGYVVYLNNSLISAKSKMQECVTLSVAEAELMALISCVQEMIHVKQLIESMSLNVKLPLTIKVDNKGAKDLVNNWSIGGRTRHVGVRLNYLRELKEKGFIEVNWIRSADILTKNLPIAVYQKHIKSLRVGNWNLKKENAPGEGVKDKISEHIVDKG
jgi:hypothetical protein